MACPAVDRTHRLHPHPRYCALVAEHPHPWKDEVLQAALVDHYNAGLKAEGARPGCPRTCHLKLPNCPGRVAPQLCRGAQAGDEACVLLMRRMAEAGALAHARGLSRDPGSRMGERIRDSIFVTGGIGDFVALESHTTPEMRSGIKRITYATRQWRGIKALIDACPDAFRALEEQTVVWDGGNGRFALNSLAEAEGLLELPDLLEFHEDWSIMWEFPRIANRELKFAGSSFLRHNVANLERMRLPAQFILIHPASVNAECAPRDLDAADWAWLVDHLERNDLVGVVVGTPPLEHAVPETPRLIDLVGRTTLPESVELLKRASGFVGCASCLSVLAAQRFRSPYDLIVKGSAPNLVGNRPIYFAPHREWPFLRASLTYDPLAGYLWRKVDEDLDRAEGREILAQRELPVAPNAIYDADYFDKYVGYEDTPIARALNAARVALVARHVGRDAGVLDVGIGSGEFLRAWGEGGYGYDVNPVAIDRLRAAGAWADPLREPLPPAIAAVTFWDSLEHMDLPGELLGRLPDGIVVCVALPIFRTLSSVRESKHYRPGEHLVYFTERGFVDYMSDLGYVLLETSAGETDSGRESIGAYAFRKDPAAALRWQHYQDRDPGPPLVLTDAQYHAIAGCPHRREYREEGCCGPKFRCTVGYWGSAEVDTARCGRCVYEGWTATEPSQSSGRPVSASNSV